MFQILGTRKLAEYVNILKLKQSLKRFLLVQSIQEKKKKILALIASTGHIESKLYETIIKLILRLLQEIVIDLVFTCIRFGCVEVLMGTNLSI